MKSWSARSSSLMRGQPPLPFIAPEGVHLVRIDRTSGRRVYGGWPGTDNEGTIIWEAFKAETEPKRSIRQDELAARGDKLAPERVLTDWPGPPAGSHR